jgi:hypothetical protein
MMLGNIQNPNLTQTSRADSTRSQFLGIVSCVSWACKMVKKSWLLLLMVKCSIGRTARGNLERNGKSRKCALVVVSTHETDVRPCSPPSPELMRVYSKVQSIVRFEDEIRLWVVVHCVVDESSGNVGGGGDLFRRGSLVGGGVLIRKGSLVGGEVLFDGRD